MFNSKFFILLIAINSAFSLKKDTKLGKKIPTKIANCAKIKCPAVEQPICAKLVYRSKQNRTIYVVMVNKCEMNYVKCHEGLEATIVPMESCDHNNLIKEGKKRSKRSADATLPPGLPKIEHMILEVPNEDEQLVGDNEQDAEKSEGTDVRTGDDAAEGSGPENTGEEYASENMPPLEFGDVNADRYEDISEPPAYGNDYSYDPSNQTENDAQEYTYPEQGNENQGNDYQGNYYQDHNQGTNYHYHLPAPINDYQSNNYQYNNYNGNNAYNEDQDESDYQYNDEEYEDEDESYEYDKTNLHGAGELTGDLYDNVFHNPGGGADDEVDLKQYYAECPTVCPSRDLMVCAKCQHGVYRTFLTTCHMRMFRCRHTDDALELISRLPCVMSAPYMPDVSMQPRGRVREPGDEDRVLRFLRCRELSQQSREADSRCKFVSDQDTRLMLDTYKVADDY